jgi:hypothetical protein
MLNDIPLRRGMTEFTNFNSLGWTADIHPNGGNVVFRDWHMQWLNGNTTSRAGKKILWPSGREYMEAGFLAFWLRFGSVTGRCGHAPSPKPRSEWLQYFFTALTFCKAAELKLTVSSCRNSPFASFARSVQSIRG